MGFSAGSITVLLRDHFGKPTPPPRLPVLDELVKTILSQNTNDRNRDLAFHALKKSYPRWKDSLLSPPGGLESVIAPAGLGFTRGRTISGLLAMGFIDGGESFRDLEGVSREEGMKTLMSVRGWAENRRLCPSFFLWNPRFSCRHAHPSRHTETGPSAGGDRQGQGPGCPRKILSARRLSGSPPESHSSRPGNLQIAQGPMRFLPTAEWLPYEGFFGRRKEMSAFSDPKRILYPFRSACRRKNPWSCGPWSGHPARSRLSRLPCRRSL